MRERHKRVYLIRRVKNTTSSILSLEKMSTSVATSAPPTLVNITFQVTHGILIQRTFHVHSFLPTTNNSHSKSSNSQFFANTVIPIRDLLTEILLKSFDGRAKLLAQLFIEIQMCEKFSTATPTFKIEMQGNAAEITDSSYFPIAVSRTNMVCSHDVFQPERIQRSIGTTFCRGAVF